jgi:hypothetical protein
MVADGLLTRQRYREVPPRVDYELTERARDLMPVLGALAHWGHEWVWGPPRTGEAIDVGAIFRLAPGLMHPPKTLRGDVELVVNGRKDGNERHYVLSADAGSVSLAEREAPDARAHVTGSEKAWVDALSPNGSFAELKFEGDERLAQSLLDGLAAPATRNGAATTTTAAESSAA